MGIIKTILTKSIGILRKEGISGLLKRRREYYKAYMPLRYHLYYYIYSLLSHKKTTIRNIQENKMLLNLYDTGLSKQLFFYDYREPNCTELTKKLLKPGMTILEIGANIGYYTMIESKAIGKKGIIHAFEPSSKNFEFLEKNVSLNNYDDRVKLYNSAVSNVSGTTKLFTPKKMNRSNMLSDNGGKYESVKSVIIDDFFGKFFNPNFIRMDVEGFEYYIFDGMINTLKRSKNCIIYMEYHPYLIDKDGLDYHKPIELLFSLGFRPIYIVKEYGSLLEETFSYYEPNNVFFEFLEKKKLLPPDYTHGMGLFLVKDKKEIK